MSKGFTRKIGRQQLLLAAAACAFVLLVVVSFGYRSYLYSLGWHSAHGQHAMVSEHKVRLPFPWRSVDVEDYDTHSLVRACSSDTFPEPEITMRPFKNAPKTSQQLLQSVQSLISARNAHPVLGASSSLVVLHPPSRTLYCEKIETRLFVKDLLSHLFCVAADIPYTFTYDGPVAFEHEAESILSSLE